MTEFDLWLGVVIVVAIGALYYKVYLPSPDSNNISPPLNQAPIVPMPVHVMPVQSPTISKFTQSPTISKFTQSPKKSYSNYLTYLEIQRGQQIDIPTYEPIKPSSICSPADVSMNPALNALTGTNGPLNMPFITIALNDTCSFATNN